MGYETRHQDIIRPEFKEITVGNIVRGSINEAKNIIPYNFRVLYVKPEETFVLEKWGTFLLEEVSPKQTRLVIRSQEVKSSNQWVKIASYIEIPLHYIMERRMIMGIKARVEAGENVHLSQNEDIFWFSGIVLSGFLICFLIFIGRGIIQSLIIPLVFSSGWLFSLLIFKPIFLYSITLLLVICVVILCVILKKQRMIHL